MNKHFLPTLISKVLLIVFFGITINSCQQEKSTYLYVIEQDGKYGYIDSVGTIVIKPQYIFGSNFREELALVVVDTVIMHPSPDYSNSKNASDSLLAKFLSERSFITFKYGYINSSNRFIIEPSLEYSELFTPDLEKAISNKEFTMQNFNFYEGLAVFKDKKTNKFGYINKKGEIVIPPKFLKASIFSEGLAAVNFGEASEKWGYIDKEGNSVIEGKYSIANRFSEGLATVLITGVEDFDISSTNWDSLRIGMSSNWLVINRKGNMHSGPFNGFLNRLLIYSEGFSVVEKHFFGEVFGYRFIDKEGNFTTDFDLMDVTRFEEGYAGVQISEDSWVFVDTSFNVVSEKFEEVYPFSDGLAAVKEDGKWGYIDTNFNLVIPAKYDSCGLFLYQLAPFSLKSMSLIIEGYINREGKIVYQKEKFDYSK